MDGYLHWNHLENSSRGSLISKTLREIFNNFLGYRMLVTVWSLARPTVRYAVTVSGQAKNYEKLLRCLPLHQKCQDQKSQTRALSVYISSIIVWSKKENPLEGVEKLLNMSLLWTLMTDPDPPIKYTNNLIADLDSSHQGEQNEPYLKKYN